MTILDEQVPTSALRDQPESLPQGLFSKARTSALPAEGGNAVMAVANLLTIAYVSSFMICPHVFKYTIHDLKPSRHSA